MSAVRFRKHWPPGRGDVLVGGNIEENDLVDKAIEDYEDVDDVVDEFDEQDS